MFIDPTAAALRQEGDVYRRLGAMRPPSVRSDGMNETPPAARVFDKISDARRTEDRCGRRL